MNEKQSPAQLNEDGKAAYQKGNFQDAACIFQAAAEAYRASGDELNEAEMANNRGVALLQAGDAHGALRAVEGTDLTFLAAKDFRRQAMALGNQAAALEALERFDEAIAAYEQGAELFKQIGEHDLRAPLMQSLATLQLRTGKQLQAIATMRSGLGEIKQPSPRQRLLKKLLQAPFKFIFRL
jgi:tetratricopeptide (TPR) repeat protein